MTLLLDELVPGLTLQVEAEACLGRVDSPWQRVEVWQTAALGRLFTLDGRFMTAERDEFVHHENLVQPNALSHADPRTALIIGGGDGGSARQLLKHGCIQRIDLVELDEAVVDLARQHLQCIHHGALDDPRVHITIGDGRRFVEQPGPCYDLMVLDLSAPHGHAAALYTVEFYLACAARLAAGGLLSLHVGNPQFQAQQCRGIIEALRQAFAVVRPLVLPITLYGGQWLMASAGAELDIGVVATRTLRDRLQTRGLRGLQYYNEDVHVAQLQLPGLLKQLLANC